MKDFAPNYDAEDRIEIVRAATQLHQRLEDLKKQGTNVYEPLMRTAAVMADKSSTIAEFSARLAGAAPALCGS